MQSLQAEIHVIDAHKAGSRPAFVVTEALSEGLN